MSSNGHWIDAALGHQIAYFRTGRSWSVAELATRAGLSASDVESIERGKLVVQLEHMRRLASGLDVRLSELVDIDDGGRAKPGGFRHSVITANVIRVLGNLLVDGPFIVLGPGVPVASPQSPAFAWPDVTVAPHVPELAGAARWIVGEPIVIVEVMTPMSEAFDRGDKFAACRTIASLLDYVLVDSERVMVEQYRRFDDEQWQLFEHGEGGRLTFAGLPGSIAVDDVYPREWPACASRIMIRLRRSISLRSAVTCGASEKREG